MIYEQKPQLPDECPQMPAMAELFVQAFYAMKYDSIIGCVGDSKKFFYFYLILSGTTVKINCVFYSKSPTEFDILNFFALLYLEFELYCLLEQGVLAVTFHVYRMRANQVAWVYGK